VSAPYQQSQPSQRESNFGDSSGPIFSMYSKAAEEEDKNMADRWQKDADGILIFVRPRVSIILPFNISWDTRPVYSPLPLLRCLPLQSRT
jgi:hypothetical protein